MAGPQAGEKRMSDVPLREFIERIIAENNRWRDDLRREDNARVDASILAVDKARSIQAGEYERRLEALNHAHSEAQRVLHTYALAKDFQELKGKVELDISEILSRLKNVENTAVALEVRLKNMELSDVDRASRSKGVIVLFQVVSGLAILISVAVAVLNYAKTGTPSP